MKAERPPEEIPLVAVPPRSDGGSRDASPELELQRPRSGMSLNKSDMAIHRVDLSQHDIGMAAMPTSDHHEIQMPLSTNTSPPTGSLEISPGSSPPPTSLDTDRSLSKIKKANFPEQRNAAPLSVLTDGSLLSDHHHQKDEGTPSKPTATYFTAQSLRSTIHYARLDCIIALILAMAINATILIVGASAFWANGYTEVEELQDAHRSLDKFVGHGTGTLFALALLASGQSSTLTGTMAGQVGVIKQGKYLIP